MTIIYLDGDATRLPQSGFIVHCCNNLGRWGAGFTDALTKRWGPGPRLMYESAVMSFGNVSFCQVEPALYVANVIGQDGVRQHHHLELPPIRYEALRRGFEAVTDYAYREQAHAEYPQRPQIHMPRIGCGLAGGDWALVEPLIHATFVRRKCSVNVYTLPGAKYFDSRMETPGI